MNPTDIAFWARYEDVLDLADTLFPHGEAPKSLDDIGLHFVVVALHGSLEALARGLGIRGALPAALRDRLKDRGLHAELDSGTYDALRTCAALRHIVVHNRATVDRNYLLSVANSPHAEGERRAIDRGEVESFTRAVRKAADLLKRSERAAT